jgi:type IX secretion system PorP/SprF family membrane protein
MKKAILLLPLLLIVVAGHAQQDAQFTQYMYNTVNVNPAYAGSREAMSIFILHRTQWVGLEGAPITNTASINTPIKNSNLGIGVSFSNDKIGPSTENNIAADLSYTIPTSDTYKLSFGIKGSANLVNVDFTKLDKYPGDPIYDENIDNKFSPNIGVGLYLHSDKTYVGFSAPNLLETRHFDKYASKSSESHLATQRLHFYFITGHVFDISPNVKFKPALLSKVVQGAPLQVDVSANFMFNDKFVAGIAYRWSASVNAMVGFQASESWFIGYSYDLETTRLAMYNSGSHEIFLRYELFNKYDKIISPRFF